MNRLNVTSAVYALSYVCVALVAAGLGPLIPIKADQMDRKPTDFKWAFVFKGVGCILGTVLGLKIEQLFSLHRAMGAAYLLVGVCALLTYQTTNMIVFECIFMAVEFSKMVVNVCTTVCILRSHSTLGEAWVKSFHFCYGIGAFVSPLIIKAMHLDAFWIYAAAVLPVASFLLLTKPKFIELTTGTETIPILSSRENSTELQSTPPKLNVLLACLLFFTTGNEATFAGWLTSYGRMGNRLPVETCLVGESIFWICMSTGRGLAIPVSLYWTNSKQLTMLVSGLFLTLLLCNVLSWLALYELVVYLGSGLLGLFASSVYPLTMSMPASLRLKATSRNTSIYAMGGCVGVALLPFVVGMVMERFGPNSLFVCMQAIAVGMVVLFICVQRTNKQITYKPPTIDALQESQITTV